MEWFEAMEFIARDVWRITKPGGRVAILTNDYLKDKRFIPVGYRMLSLFEEVGFEAVALILDVHNNYVYNSNAFIVANAKRFRYRLNALRQIIVFGKNPTGD
ncbi:MAG: hypothetical protein DPW09_41320 [Anaerolineae bacterium]|nr:hypothetical protein [Anaerolineae bacterium]